MENYKLLDSRDADILLPYCRSAVDQITNYATSPKTRGEMLIPSVDDLIDVHRSGFGAIGIDGDGRFVAHAALWPLLDSHDFSVRELGSWIVDEDYRHIRLNGRTVGEWVAGALLDSAHEADIGVIATVKRANALRGFKKVGGKKIDFSEYPFLAGLTCVCPDTSEYRTGQTCEYRRLPANQIAHSFEIPLIEAESIETDPERIPCTLVGFNIARLSGIDRGLESLFREQNRGSGLTTGVRGISVDNMRSLQTFYNKLEIEL